MSSGVPLNSARRTKTYAAAALADVDGVMAGGATLETASQLTAADFDGAAMLTGGVLDLPRAITITLGNNAGAFNATDPWVLTGFRGGEQVTASFTPTTANGNEKLRSAQAFDRLLTLDIPAQADDDGTYTIGVEDICAPRGGTFTAVKLDDDGPLNVQYGEHEGSNTDTLNATGGQLEPIAPSRVLTDPSLTAPTISSLTVYLP